MQSAHETLLEWLPYQDHYISEIIDLEKPPANQLCAKCRSQQGFFQCKECFSHALLCQNCCFAIHHDTPLHHIDKWTGRFFDETSLNQEGFVLYLGHGGEACPTNHTRGDAGEVHHGSSDEGEGEGEGEGDGDGDGVPLAAWEKQDRRCLVIVNTSGVHQLRIGWCRCETAAEPHIQLLRNCQG